MVEAVTEAMEATVVTAMVVGVAAAGAAGDGAALAGVVEDLVGVPELDGAVMEPAFLPALSLALPCLALPMVLLHMSMTSTTLVWLLDQVTLGFGMVIVIVTAPALLFHGRTIFANNCPVIFVFCDQRIKSIL
jgi:hypothetical protein